MNLALQLGAAFVLGALVSVVGMMLLFRRRRARDAPPERPQIAHVQRYVRDQLRFVGEPDGAIDLFLESGEFTVAVQRSFESELFYQQTQAALKIYMDHADEWRRLGSPIPKYDVDPRG